MDLDKTDGDPKVMIRDSTSQAITPSPSKGISRPFAEGYSMKVSRCWQNDALDRTSCDSPFGSYSSANSKFFSDHGDRITAPSTPPQTITPPNKLPFSYTNWHHTSSRGFPSGSQSAPGTSYRRVRDTFNEVKQQGYTLQLAGAILT